MEGWRRRFHGNAWTAEVFVETLAEASKRRSFTGNSTLPEPDGLGLNRRVIRFAIQHLRASAWLLLCGACVSGGGTSLYAERITLDPLCIPGPSRMAPLAPGNPAPGPIKMARWLRNLYDTATPSAMSFMNDRLAARMRLDLGATTNALKLMELIGLPGDE